VDRRRQQPEHAGLSAFGFGADLFRVMVDGVSVFDGTFGNYFPTDCAGPGTQLTASFGGFAEPDYGYNTSYRDCGRAVTFTFAHSAAGASLSFAFPNSQGAPAEAFGVDNVVVRTDASPPVTAAPEPATWTLLGAGLVALGAAARRRVGRGA
jgi:hypothetical protein